LTFTPKIGGVGFLSLFFHFFSFFGWKKPMISEGWDSSGILFLEKFSAVKQCQNKILMWI
jgi:hypothetical protein